MKLKKSLIAALSLVLAVPSIAVAKDKKGQRGMLESMQSVPCGAKERGVTGLGSVFGSVGVQHVNSHEQLCPQYLLRTDQMDYHIRPLDLKHAAVLPVGHEAEFKIKKDRLFLKIPDGDKKERDYQVVSMEPVSSESKIDSTAYHPVEKPVEPGPPNPTSKDAGNSMARQAVVPPPQQ
ncbi:MAG: hypothetical protein WBD25_17740 [Terriglobales bacterium]|jgi:hypothetical protein